MHTEIKSNQPQEEKSPLWDPFALHILHTYTYVTLVYNMGSLEARSRWTQKRKTKVEKEKIFTCRGKLILYFICECTARRWLNNVNLILESGPVSLSWVCLRCAPLPPNLTSFNSVISYICFSFFSLLYLTSPKARICDLQFFFCTAVACLALPIRFPWILSSADHKVVGVSGN